LDFQGFAAITRFAYGGHYGGPITPDRRDRPGGNSNSPDCPFAHARHAADRALPANTALTIDATATDANLKYQLDVWYDVVNANGDVQ
jgi:hypothetical protein